jgi:hypothetical protein
VTRLEEYSFRAVLRIVATTKAEAEAAAKTLRGQVIGVPGRDDAHIHLTDEPVADRSQFLR